MDVDALTTIHLIDAHYTHVKLMRYATLRTCISYGFSCAYTVAIVVLSARQIQERMSETIRRDKTRERERERWRDRQRDRETGKIDRER